MNQPIALKRLDRLSRDPEHDGYEYINIDFNARTVLGRALSHFYRANFNHPKYGPFQSVEGFRWWLRAEKTPEADQLRYAAENTAKQMGSCLPRATPLISWPELRQALYEANFYKIVQNAGLLDMMLASELPFNMYFIDRKSNQVITPVRDLWIVDMFEKIRSELKEGVREPTSIRS